MWTYKNALRGVFIAGMERTTGGERMKDLKKEGYLEAVSEIGIAQDEQIVFEQNFSKFKSFLFAKSEVYGGRWWVGSLTYQQAIESKVGKFPNENS